MNLRGKKILFIAPQLFGIPEKITTTLHKQGAMVDYYDERPANTFIIKALIRINRNIISYYINQYHASIIKKTRDKFFDYIFFIKGESFSKKNLEKLITGHPESISIVYHWDSIKNNPNALNLLNCFDYKFSFDRLDCEKFGMKFLPLFYYDEYASIAQPLENYEYAMMFVGTVHSDRYFIVKTLTDYMHQQGKKVYNFFYFQGKIMFYKYLLLHREIKHFDNSTVHFSPISEIQLLNLYTKSGIIVDVNHPKQTGLTLRCIEALGARRKLITTNQDIKNYDFYNPNNILIIDRDNPVIPKSFIESPYLEVPSNIYNMYSLSNWCSKIFH